MEEIKQLKVQEFTTVITGGTPSRRKDEYWNDGTIPWLNSGELNQNIITTTRNYITESGLKNSSARLMPANSVLIALTGSTTGKAALLKFEACANQSVTGILPSKNHDSQYLYQFFKRQKEQIFRKSWGGAQPHINQRFIKEYIVPLPSLPNQKRIAYLLSSCEGLIAKRKESIALLDEFLKSTFLEMFGGEFLNINKWKTKLKEIAPTINSGWSPKCESYPRNSKKEWAVLKLSSVSYKRFKPNQNKLCFSDTVIKKEVVPKSGDLLFSRKNTAHLVGASAYVFKDYEKLLLPDTIFKINYNKEKASGIFLWYLFNNEIFSQKVRSLATGAAGSMPNISKAKLLNIAIPNISFDLQNEFTEIVQKTEKIKAQYASSLLDLEQLYGSISQQAFAGELDLDKVDIAKLLEEEEKLEMEPVGELKWEGKNQFQDYKIDLEEIIRINFSEELFSVEDIEDYVSEKAIFLDSEQIKKHLKDAISKNTIEQVYSKIEEQIMFKLIK